MRRGTTSRVLLAVASLALAVAIPAEAGTIETRGLASAECAGRLSPPAAPGVAARAWSAPAGGVLTARLTGGRASDWDLAIFDRSGRRPLAASTSFTSRERAEAWVRPGEPLVIQACRHHGTRHVPLSLDFARVAPPAAPAERISLESVALADAGDVARLEDLGVELTEDITPAAATVLLHSDAERALLASQGFATRTLIPDLARHNAAERRSERRLARGASRSALPSGRNAYRHYPAYTSALKGLAEENPGLVRSIELGQSIEGRPIEGVEIAANVNRTGDGRPVYLNMGLHHAREWPSGEFPMEFAIDLVDRFNAGGARVTALLNKVRVVIVPVVNPDGFIVSRDTAAGEFRRKNCRPTLGDASTPCAARSTASGVDLNRNYGAYWGGAGSSASPSSDLYRGASPYSEPESEAVHQYTSGIHPTVFITNHTFTNEGVWLRQPGFTAEGTTTPDEPAMKALGDEMAAATGWQSELAWTLGEITGATEDWNYFAQGTYGYTPEARGNSFHGGFSNMVVKEYVGDAAHSGLGVREAFLIAAERAGDAAHHGIVAGTAPPKARLKLQKSFETPTSQSGLVVEDFLDTRLTVPQSGRYRWHVNPSSRPLVDGETWTMRCRTAGGGRGTTQIAVDRGQKVTVDWAPGCTPP